ncbi:MAG: hypothetical protein HFI93_06880 [Lachnospiraceae bacterium]|nr:hypothetical protein [Lachnospiraceae bacterium]
MEFARKPFFCYLAVLLLSVGLLALLRLNQTFLPNGSLLPPPEETTLYTLTDPDWSPDTGRCLVELSLSSPAPVSFAIVRSAAGPIRVTINGIPHENLSYYPNSRQIVFLNLTSDEVQKKGDRIRLEIYTERWDSSDQIYVGSEYIIQQTFLLHYRILRAVVLTILFIMFFYGLSLYYFKQSERYLRYFLAYMALLILWLMMTGTRFLDFLPTGPYNFIQVCGHLYVAYMPFCICLMLTEMPLPSRLQFFFRWQGMLFVPLFLGIPAYRTSFAFVTGCILFLCFLFGGRAVIWRCRKKLPGCYILLIGFAVMVGWKFQALLVDYGLAADSLLFFLMRKTRFLNLPFSFAYLLFVNQKFAGKFQEAEDLSCLLEQKVRERTAELNRQQELRRGMMLNMFHDLRSPLFAIRTCAASLTASDPGEEELLTLLNDRIDFLSCLTEDLFAAARLEDDDLLFSEDPVNLHTLLSHTVQGALPLAKKRQVTLSWQSETECFTWGDGSYLARAMQNLIVNGIQYTPSGKQVFITLRSAHNRALITIRDEGKGIAPEDLPHIFERYFHKNETTPNHSTGLGLSIAYSIIQKHKGEIQVSSVPGKGSTFSVSLPLWHPPASNV